MKRGANVSTGVRTWLVLLLACGTILLTTTACDTNVQTALVTGMNQASVTAASALINAAFLTITPDDSTTGGTGNTGTGGTGNTGGTGGTPQI